MILSQLLKLFLPVYQAKTEEELFAIQRFRYEICVSEQKDKKHFEINHEKKIIESPEDKGAGTYLFYTGSSENITGTIRVNIWDSVEFYKQKANIYSLNLFPNIKNLKILETNYFMVTPIKRGSAITLSLISRALDIIANEHIWDINFSTCVPGLIKSYYRLGLRTYGGQPIATPVGFLLPLIIISNDLDHLKRINSPWLPTFAALKKRNRLSQKDLSAFIHIAEGYRGIETDPEAIFKEIENSLSQAMNSDLTSILPADILERFSKTGFVLDLDPGSVVVQEGGVDQDLFLILDGVAEVRKGNQYIRTLTKGDIFGEINFLNEPSNRTASVIVTVPSRILILRKTTLKRLETDSPQDALAVYKALSKIVIERIFRNPMASRYYGKLF